MTDVRAAIEQRARELAEDVRRRAPYTEDDARDLAKLITMLGRDQAPTT